MQPTRTPADTLQNSRLEDTHAESIVIWELSEKGMEQSRVLQIHESILFTLFGAIQPFQDEVDVGGSSL